MSVFPPPPRRPARGGAEVRGNGDAPGADSEVAVRRHSLTMLVKSMAEIYVSSHIPLAAGAFSYFFTLSVFPLLICLYYMLGGLFPAADSIRAFLNGILPEETTGIILDFLRYVSENTSTYMLVVALGVLVTSSSAMYRTTSDVIGGMRGVKRFTGFFNLIASVVFSLVFLASFYAAAILILTGKWFLDFVDRYVMFLNISDGWTWIRFLLLFLLVFVMFSGVYRIMAPKVRTVRLLPGAALGSLALLVVSIFFALFIGRSARYPLVYGSLASIILMMFWMYCCGVVLFMGCALNVSLERLADAKKSSRAVRYE